MPLGEKQSAESSYTVTEPALAQILLQFTGRCQDHKTQTMNTVTEVKPNVIKARKNNNIILPGKWERRMIRERFNVDSNSQRKRKYLER